MVQTIKSITAREVFRQVPGVKKLLWGGEFWGKGYYVSTVGKHGDETTLAGYVRKQSNDKNYKLLHLQQLKLWGSVFVLIPRSLLWGNSFQSHFLAFLITTRMG